MEQEYSLSFEMNFKNSILVSGKIATGKSSLINFLTNKFQISITSFGSMVKKKALEENIDPIKENLQKLGYELFTSLGPRKLLEEAIKNSKMNNAEKIIFDGVRHELILSEIEKISDKLLLIYLNAEENIRFSRYKTYTGIDNLSLQEFQELDSHPIELGTEKLSTYADLVIDTSKPFDNVCSLASEKIQHFFNQ